MIKGPSNHYILTNFHVDLTLFMNFEPFPSEVLSFKNSDKKSSQLNFGLCIIFPLSKLFLSLVIVINLGLMSFLLCCLHFDMVLPHLTLMLYCQVPIASFF